MCSHCWTVPTRSSPASASVEGERGEGGSALAPADTRSSSRRRRRRRQPRSSRNIWFRVSLNNPCEKVCAGACFRIIFAYFQYDLNFCMGQQHDFPSSFKRLYNTKETYFTFFCRTNSEDKKGMLPTHFFNISNANMNV